MVAALCLLPLSLLLSFIAWDWLRLRRRLLFATVARQVAGTASLDAKLADVGTGARSTAPAKETGTAAASASPPQHGDCGRVSSDFSRDSLTPTTPRRSCRSSSPNTGGSTAATGAACTDNKP